MSSDASNRERLLRLIDGGPEALKELQGPPPVSPPRGPAPGVSAWQSGKRLLTQWKSKVPAGSSREIVRLGQWLLVFVGVLASFHYGVQALKTLKPGQPAAAVPAGTPSDEAGVGLRLVGVDSSGPPVALLEDLQTGKTYFARVDERVKNVRVKQILKNKVLVSARGKTVELS